MNKNYTVKPQDLFMGSGGGGGGSSSPTNAPDSLFSEDLVEFALAISEGPIKGLVEGPKSFYVGGTPLVSKSGTKNFEKFAIGLHPGYAEGAAKPLNLLLGGLTSNVQVGVTLLSQVPVTRVTSSALRGNIDELEIRINFQRLMQSGPKGTFAAKASFKIEYKATASPTWINFYSSDIVEISGKTSSGYVKEFRATVPPLPNDDWQVRVTKISPDTVDSSTASSSDLTYVDLAWESLQATTKSKQTFPDTAIIHGIGVANGQFSSIPDFGGIYDGLVIRVPVNYNPITRTYDESTPWEGDFKFEWTNNPAWVLYDLLTNNRYGLAAHRAFISPNRFDFYLAAKWCDAPVKTGVVTVNEQGVEVDQMQPRYTFNDLISDARPVREAIAYVAGSFNALIWDDLSGQIHLRVDKDEPAVMVFTPESVTDAGFSYSFTDLALRANDISVSFINPDLDWNEDRRRVPGYTTDEAAIARYGRIPLDFVAVGCTDVHEALRKARVRLISAQTETTTVSFTTTRLGAVLDLYSVILVADPTMGWAQSGRITKISEGYIHFRDAIYIETMKTYGLKLQTPSGMLAFEVLPDQIGAVTKLKITSGTVSAYVPANATFTLEDTGGFGYAKPFRVVSIGEADGSPYAYTITAVEVNRTKFFDAENQTTTPEFQYSYKEPALPDTPQNFKLESGDKQLLIDTTGHVINRIQATWRKPLGANISKYELQFRLTSDTDTEWQTILTDVESAYIQPVTAGTRYAVRVRAIAPDGRKSNWVQILDYLVEGKTLIPFPPQYLHAVGDIFQNNLDWAYDPRTIDLKKIQIFGALTAELNKATLLVELAYPTSKWSHIGLDSAKTVYYWARVQDSSGNFSAYTPVVSATTSNDPSKILDILRDSVTESQLYADLRTRISLIDGPASLIGSVAHKIEVEQNARNQAVLAETQARIAALQAEVAARQAAITQATTTSQTATDSLASQLGILTSRVGANAAAIATEQTTRSTETTSLAQQLNTLVSNVANNQASVTSALQALTTKDSSLASSIDALIARVNDNTASIVNEQTARANADLAEAAARQQLDTAYKAADTQKLNEAKGYVQSYAYSKSDVDASQASLSTNITTAYRTYADTKKAEAITAAAADVRQFAYSKSQSDSAVASLSSSLTTSFQGYADTKKVEAIAASAADVRNFAYSKSEANAAIATQTSTLSTTVGQHTTAIQTHTQSINGLGGQLTFKIDNNGHVSGIGLASTTVNGVPTSSVIINSDVFAIAFPGEANKNVLPFVIGQVNGVTGIGFNGNLMIDGSVSIRDATGNVIFSSGVKLDGTYIQNASIDTLNLKNNAFSQIVSSSTNSAQIEIGSDAEIIISTIGGVPLSGTQPILVWANALLAGAHVTTSGETPDVNIGGTNWTHNLVDSDVSFWANFYDGTRNYLVQLATNHTVIKGIGQNVALQGTFYGANIPLAGTYQLHITARVTSGRPKIGARYRTISAMETKR